ncbi:MAG: histidine phosphatase family protein [Pirellulales bacterium]
MAVDSTAHRQLLIMRHAKSSWAEAGMADFDRPLNDRGRRAAQTVGDKLKSTGFEVDLIIGSTACRVRQTVDILQPAWGSAAPKFLSKELYLASREELLRQIRALDSSFHRVLIVAHNPGIEELAGWFTESPEHFPTGAALWLKCRNEYASWQQALSEGEWNREAFWKPRELE